MTILYRTLDKTVHKPAVSWQEHRSDACIAPGERRADVFTYSALLSNLLRSGNEGGGPRSVMQLPPLHRSTARYFVIAYLVALLLASPPHCGMVARRGADSQVARMS